MQSPPCPGEPGGDDCRRGPLAIRRRLRSPVASTLRCRMVCGPLARPEGRTVTAPPVVPRRGFRRLRRSRCTRKCLDPDAGRQPHPKVVPTTSKIQPHGFEAARPDPGFESTTLRAVPDSRRSRALHDDWAARRRSHPRRNASLRATPRPSRDSGATPRALPEGSSRGAGEPRRVHRGFRLPQGNPWGPAQARQTLHPCGRRDGTRSPHGPEGRVPTWIRRVRGRTA